MAEMTGETDQQRNVGEWAPGEEGKPAGWPDEAGRVWACNCTVKGPSCIPLEPCPSCGFRWCTTPIEAADHGR